MWHMQCNACNLMDLGVHVQMNMIPFDLSASKFPVLCSYSYLLRHIVYLETQILYVTYTFIF